MGADGVDATTGEIDPNWLTEHARAPSAAPSSRCCSAVVPPLVFTAIVVSIANLREVTNAARLAGQTLLWFAITALIAVVHRHRPRPAHPARATHSSRRRRARRRPRTTGSWLDFLTGLVPANILGLEGYARRRLGRLVVQRAADPRGRDRRRHRRAQGRRGGRAVPRLRPLRARRRAEGAVVGHPARPDRHRRPDRQRRRHLRLGRPRLARHLHRRGLRRPARWCCSSSTRCCCGCTASRRAQFFSGAWPAIQLAFVSRSSVGTMPVTQRVTERNLGVPRSYASFAVPLGATTKMDGCAAIYPALAAIFVAQFFGVAPVDHRLPADRVRLGDRLGRHRRPHRRDRHADADALHAGPAAGRRRACCWPSTRSSTWAAPRSTSPGQALVPTIVAKREGILDVERYRVDVHRSTRWPGSRRTTAWTPTCACPPPSDAHPDDGPGHSRGGRARRVRLSR